MRIMVIAVLLAVVVVLSGCAHFERKPTSDYDTLRMARLFSIGRITDAGVVSEAEKAFRAILEEPGGSAQFQRLLSTATPEGQLYGLLGLRLLDKRAFEAAAPRYKDSFVRVATMQGCSAGHSPTMDIARKISAGEFK